MGLRELVERLIEDGPDAFMLVDDSVQDKRYSQFIELVKLQYSGTEHGLIRGIGIVNWCIVLIARKISIQLTIGFMRRTKMGRPRTITFLNDYQCSLCQGNKGKTHFI